MSFRVLYRVVSFLTLGSSLFGYIAIDAGQVPPRSAFVSAGTPSSQTFLPPPGGASPTPPHHGTLNSSPPQSPTSSSWSSYVTIDPSNIISLLIKRAGFFLDPQLKQLATLLHCDEVKLNIIEKQLLIHNFTVSIPKDSSIIGRRHSRQQEDDAALRIGKIHVRWDSYRRPCLEIQVENVDILVEFTNLLLTRNNWNELQDLGFPPTVTYYYDDPSTDTTKDKEYGHVRIGSLDLCGQVVLHTKSRPLQQPIIEDIIFQLDVLRELNNRIKILADQNAVQYKRRGCTTDEVNTIVQSYLFNTKIKEAIKFALEDIITSQVVLKNQSKRIAKSAKAAILSYANNIDTLSKEKIKQQLRVQGKNEDVVVPLDEEELDRLVSGGLDTLKASAKGYGSRALQSLKNGMFRYNTASNSINDEEEDDVDSSPNSNNGTKKERKVVSEHANGDIMFPDW